MNTDFHVLGLAGRAGVGKTTSATYIESRLHFKKLSFADELRAIAMQLYPWITPIHFNHPLKNEIDPTIGKSPRRILQLLGTEVGRLIWDNTWVDIIRRKIEQTESLGAWNGVVIDDVRFPNEVNMIKGIGGTLWVIKRDLVESNSSIDSHDSESHVESMYGDADSIIENNGTIFDLHNIIHQLITSTFSTERVGQNNV